MKWCAMLTTLLLFSLVAAKVYSQEGTAILANIDYSLSKEEFDRLYVSAMEGSPADAHRIVEFFVFSKRNNKRAEYWARIGAENGSADWQFAMFQFLSISKKVDDHRRALFWLAHAAKGGNRHAVSIYQTCNALDARYRNPVRSPCFGPDSDD